MTGKYGRISSFADRKKGMLQGSITVEAVFVMPVVILAVFALLYLSFYLHDASRVQGIINSALHKTAMMDKHITDLGTGRIAYENINDRGVFYPLAGDRSKEERQLAEYLRQQLSEGLFLSKVTRISVEAGVFSWSLEAEVSTAVTMPMFHFLFDRVAHRVISEEYPVHNPADALRQYEVILDTASEIKGVDELRRMIEAFNTDAGTK